MEIRPLLPDLLYRQLEERDATGAIRILESARGRPESWKHLRAGMRRYVGLHEPAEGEVHASVVLDALSDLVPTFEGPAAFELIHAAALYLVRLPVSHPRVDLFDPGSNAPDVIPISSLEDALSEGDAEKTARVIATLVRVIRTREYFLELLLETIAAERTADGRLLTQAGATVKLLHDVDWEPSRPLVWRMIEAVSRSPVAPGLAISHVPPPVPCRAAYLRAIEVGREPEAFWLYLAHAFQAERYAELRKKGVRWGLREWIAERLFAGDPAGMDAAEEALGPRRPKADPEAESLPQLPEGFGSRLAERIAAGSSDMADEAGEQAGRLADVDPLYRWIAQGTAGALARGDARALLAANGARWGAHLLDPRGAARLTRRAVERTAALVAG
ncbi:MAG: hypothetical protein ACE15D_16100 [Candidatus Eisenbacteria bacterium]